MRGQQNFFRFWLEIGRMIKFTWKSTSTSRSNLTRTATAAIPTWFDGIFWHFLAVNLIFILIEDLATSSWSNRNGIGSITNEHPRCWSLWRFVYCHFPEKIKEKKCQKRKNVMNNVASICNNARLVFSWRKIGFVWKMFDCVHFCNLQIPPECGVKILHIQYIRYIYTAARGVEVSV